MPSESAFAAKFSENWNREEIELNAWEDQPIEERFYCKEEFVLDQLKKLDSSTATGSDLVPAKLLKTVAPLISKPLTETINRILDKREFPKAWKFAYICPVPKTERPEAVKDKTGSDDITDTSSNACHAMSY